MRRQTFRKFKIIEASAIFLSEAGLLDHQEIGQANSY